ncbi:MAG: acetylxylan esterase [Bacteroidota bacterium]
MKKSSLFFLISVIILFTSSISFTQNSDINYDESKVPAYTLPDPLILEDGSEISNKQDWLEKKRPEILQLFESEVYGKAPGKPDSQKYKVISEDNSAFNGSAVRKEIEIIINNNDKEITFNLLLYFPDNGKKTHPVILGLNFYGNQAVCNDEKITITKNWVRNNKLFNIKNNRADESTRGVRASSWEVKYLIERGYALATIYYGDIDPDIHDGFKNGVHSLFYKNGQSKVNADEWTSISAWAWGLSRAMDYLVTDRSVDKEKVVVMGHSRLGKTALWAGAQDQRFAIAISNNSGCGGAALSRRRFGETVKKINNSFPHWFCGNFKKYNDNEDELPIDQHMLIALIAPRLAYVASAEQDRWADPHGEFLSAKNAEPVYSLFGKAGLQTESMPEVNNSVGDFIGYHIRTGKHSATKYDWEQYLNFADKHFLDK